MTEFSLPRRVFDISVIGLLEFGILLFAGCGTPIGAHRASEAEVCRQINITLPDCSLQSNQVAASVLREYGLESQFKSAPQQALQELDEKALLEPRRDLLLAMAELSCIEGERLRQHAKPSNSLPVDYFLASAIYSLLYIRGAPPTDSDPLFRSACILHNFALARSLGSSDRADLAGWIEAGAQRLPFGRVSLSIETNAVHLRGFQIEQILFANHFLVRGLNPRNRASGLGVPMIAVSQKNTNMPASICMPITAFLQLHGGLQEIGAGNARAALVLHSAFDDAETAIDGEPFPLEADFTVPLAYSLNDTFAWNVGRKQFLSAKEWIKSDIYPTQPYRPGLIPVIFVHGTFSSPAYWAELANALRADPEIRKHYQLWHYIYNSGNPVPFSAANLRQSLTNIIHNLDPDGSDAALRRIVLIGHSQGGLLAKLMTTDTGDRLWRVTHERPLEDSDLSDEQRALARGFLFYKPVPEVRRVIFIATPHRGSYLAGSFSRWAADVFLELPKQLAHSSDDFIRLIRGKKNVEIPKEILRGTPNSVSGMSPENPWLLELAAIPPAPGVKAHSIIPVKGGGDPALGGDGVVKYSSAHVDGVESELVVRSSHRCQGNPELIAEVRRILHEHLNSTQ